MRVLTTFALVFFLTDVHAETARIAGWNLGGFHQIPQSKLDRIIDGLKELDADIIVLSELNPRTHAKTIADELSEPADKCYESKAPDQPRASQDIGFVYKCDVEVTSPGLVIGSDLKKRGYRNAAVVSVKADEFDFVLIGLHLKAGRGRTNRNLRDEQLEIISGFIQGILRGGEKDVLVIGDYNMIPVQDAANFETLNADGSLRFVSSEDLTGQFSHIKSSGPGDLLDGYAFTNVHPVEYQEGSVAIVPMHQELGLTLGQYREHVTDHLPVIATFNTDVDHD